MAYGFNPTPAETSLLTQIAANESGGNYTATNPGSTASGAYQFINSTWQMAAQATGVGTQYASAAAAPAWMQDTNALWLLRAYGPNSTISWAASGPYYSVSPSSIPTGGGAAPLVDVSGAAAATPTADILNQMETSVAGVFGVDPTTGGLILAGLVGLAVLVLARR